MKRNYKVDGEQLTLAGEASSDMKKLLMQLGFTYELIRKVSIATYEAEINMVIHANGGEINLEITPKQITIHLIDQGPGIADIDLAMQEGYTTASNVAREMGFGAGMGLPNMKRYSDELYINSEIGKGTEVKIVFYI